MAKDDTESVAIPTLDRARELGVRAAAPGWIFDENLLDREPRAQRRVIALVVRALVHTRDSKEVEVDAGPTLLERLLAGAKRPDTERLVATSWLELAAPIDRSTIRPCPGCRVGTLECSACRGRGRSYETLAAGGEGFVTCARCRGTRRVTCSTCDGGKRVVTARVHRFDEQVRELEHLFAPVSPELHGALSTHLLGLEALPDAMLVDLDHPDRAGERGYRGERASGLPSFHGVDANEALHEAQTALARLEANSGSRVDRVVESHALPIEVLEYEEHHVALVYGGPDREIVATVAVPGR